MGFKKRIASTKAEVKTKASTRSPRAFIDALTDDRRKQEAKVMLKLMAQATGMKPVMWGTSIVGYGAYHYKYATGREGDWMRTGFSPRKQSLTVYCMAGFKGQQDLLKKLGPHKTSVSCLYIRRLEDVNQKVLAAIVRRSMAEMKKRYG